MTDRIKEVMTNNHGKRILCIVGVEHNYFYEEALKETGWELVYPIKRAEEMKRM
ncbi:glycosyltransferase family 1 protein [Pseudalkalibacillus caeni]|uniref:Glycosyltransferase family 1 protein n=1 Tax=Exobacillus caeni TaxID=2574798 RepID=A0A5R9F8Z5_9BACL|nr:glycosyltransferase family 1 protein [Pseudalkalibacillus caeni]TLS38088.1 glycosyltransferase family 1 protein [Pseudalkalibacillus caeni]